MNTEKTTLYIIEQGRFGGDVAGCLMTKDGEVIYSHMSSSRGWLESDLTSNFGRAAELKERFGDFSVMYVAMTDAELPAEIAHLFKRIDEEAAAHHDDIIDGAES